MFGGVLETRIREKNGEATPRKMGGAFTGYVCRSRSKLNQGTAGFSFHGCCWETFAFVLIVV